MQQDAPLFQSEAAIAVEQAVQDATAQGAAQEPAQEAAAVPEVSISHAHHVVSSFSRIASCNTSSSRNLDCCRSVSLRLCRRRAAQTARAQRQALWRWHWVRVWSCLHWPSTSQMQPSRVLSWQQVHTLAHMVVEEERLLDIIV